MTTTNGSSGPRIIQWYVDTRRMWPVPKQPKPKDEVLLFKHVAARELSLLTQAEQDSVLRYYYLRDAKTKLVSHLLKHLIITKYQSVPWSKSAISRDAKKKPCYVPEGSTTEPLGFAFNVSHQAGVVALIAAINFSGRIEVGADVVCVNERIDIDYQHIDKNGFFDWVDMHGDVFAPSELSYMKLAPVAVDLRVKGVKLSGFGRDAISRVQRRHERIGVKLTGKNGEDMELQMQTDSIIDAKLRRFYAMWCLREAYVKMSGDALLAPWLKELEILDVESPAAKEGIKDEWSLEKGEVVRQFATYMKGKVMRDVKTEMTAMGVNYMMSGSIRVPKEHHMSDVVFGDWLELNFEKDVLAIAEESLAGDMAREQRKLDLAIDQGLSSLSMSSSAE
ncbi:hypothetical protein BDZ45DRAFT_113286 [Acephala macrosclerotiorum]|nr:hypothetical protein BDZ45DRAFT_113286 [Acephala macrosclerotiorum]